MKKLFNSMIAALIMAITCTAPVQTINNPNVITLNVLTLDARLGKIPVTAPLEYFLKQNDLIVLVRDTWGMPSNIQVTDEVIQAHPNVMFIQVADSDLPELKKLYGITEMPDLMFVKNGKLAYSLTGKCLWTSSLASLIDTYLRS